ncbi:MAG: T9SS type A sorting domain-containing protein, partial [Melioribacteraceae bacterium]
PETTIKFTLPQRSKVKLEIFDVLGRVVSTIVNSDLDAGIYRYNWNASNFASGVYIYRLTANDFASSKKLMLLK